MKVFNLTALLFVSLCTGSAADFADAPAASFPFSDVMSANHIHALLESSETLDMNTFERGQPCFVSLAALEGYPKRPENRQEMQNSFESAAVHKSLRGVEMADGTMRDNERVQELVTYFKTKNIDMERLLKDERLELYDEISSRFINSAEKKTPTLKEYKDILN